MWWQNGSIIWFHLAIILPKLKNESAPWKGVEFTAPWPASEHCKVSLHFQPRVCEEATGVALSKHWKCPLHSVEDLKDGLHRDNNGMRYKLSLKKKMFYNSTTHLFSATSISYISKFACQSCYILLSILSHLGNVWQHILHQFLCCPTPKELAEGTSLHYNTYSRADCLTASAGARWLFLMRKCQYAGHQTFNLQGFDPTSHNQSHHFLNILTNQQRDNPKAWIMVQTSPEQQGDKKVPALSE